MPTGGWRRWSTAFAIASRCRCSTSTSCRTFSTATRCGRRAARRWCAGGAADFLGDPELPLAEAARDLVRERTGSAPTGPVRLLAGLRFAGHAFNPISLLYLHGADGGVEAVIAEVTNTPWGERHAYVLEGGQGTVAKRMHVSPFMGMEQSYRVVASEPGSRLALRITNLEDGRDRARGGAQPQSRGAQPPLDDPGDARLSGGGADDARPDLLARGSVATQGPAARAAPVTRPRRYSSSG